MKGTPEGPVMRGAQGPGPGLTRRRLLARAGVLAGGLSVAGLLSACGGGSGSTSGGQRSTVHGDGILHLSENQLLTRNFNPFVARPRTVTTHGMFEPLMIYNYATKKVVPWLATSFAWSNNNKTLTFKIRSGVQWSDGKPFGPKDVAFTFNLMKRFPGLLGSASGVWDTYLGSVKATADAVEFAFKDVYTPGVYDLMHQLIVPQHTWGSVDDPVKFTNPDPVSTGPFSKLTSFETQSMAVSRNPSYWQKGKPYIKGIRYSSYAGNQQLTQALITDQLDWGGGYVPNIGKVYVEKNPRDHHFWWPLTGVVNLIVNHTRAPFDQLAVRQAFAMAMDRNQMVQTALQGYTKVANPTGLAEFMYSDWIDSGVAGSGKTWMSRNVSQANQLLDQAGLKRGSDGIRRLSNGKPMSYQITVPTGWTDWISDCEVAVGNFKDIGVDVKTFTPAVDAWYTNVYTGNFDMSVGDPSSSGATPFNPYRGYMSSFTYRPIGQSAADNWHRYKNSDADRLLDQWAQTSDVTRQKQLCKQLEKIFVDELPVIPLYFQPEWGAYNSSRFAGFPNPKNAYAPLSNVAAFPTYYIVLTTVQPK